MTTEDQIKAFCADRGWRFKPWEATPWQADTDDCPWPPTSAGGESWPKARKLRAQILAELGIDDR